MDPAMTIFRERLPGVPFLKDLFPVSVSSLAPSFVPSLVSPSLFFSLSFSLLWALSYEKRHRHVVSSTTVKALGMNEEGRANTLLSEFYWNFIGQ